MFTSRLFSACNLDTLDPITARSVAFTCDENAGCAPAFLLRKGANAMQVRRRFKQALALDDRLRLFSEHLKAKAAELRPGPEQDALLKRARLADTAANINRWVASPGLQPPE